MYKGVRCAVRYHFFVNRLCFAATIVLSVGAMTSCKEDPQWASKLSESRLSDASDSVVWEVSRDENHVRHLEAMAARISPSSSGTLVFNMEQLCCFLAQDYGGDQYNSVISEIARNTAGSPKWAVIRLGGCGPNRLAASYALSEILRGTLEVEPRISDAMWALASNSDWEYAVKMFDANDAMHRVATSPVHSPCRRLVALWLLKEHAIWDIERIHDVAQQIDTGGDQHSATILKWILYD